MLVSRLCFEAGGQYPRVDRLWAVALAIWGGDCEQAFLEKRWAQEELHDLATREVDGEKVLLPVWHNVGFREICDYSPTLADRVAVSTEKGFECAVKRIIDAAKQP